VTNYKEAVKNQQEAIALQKSAMRRQKIALLIIVAVVVGFLLLLALSLRH
jgi:hypothetical protein